MAAGVKNLPNTTLDRGPRMYDFAEFIVAAEPALPWQQGQFLVAYNRNRAQSNSIALESNLVVAPLLDLVSDHSGDWRGSVKELSEKLNNKANDATKRQHSWPATPKALGNQLRRIAPNLRRQGIEISIGKKSWKGTPVSIAIGKEADPRSERSGTGENGSILGETKSDHNSPIAESPDHPYLADLQSPTSQGPEELTI